MLRLQRVVLALSALSWLAWASATLLYIPYILLYSPSVPKNPNDPDSEMRPDDEYNVSGICITLILMALLVDSLLVVAIYKPYDVSTQLFYPWLIFYGAVGIPALVTASILLAVNLESGGGRKVIGTALPLAVAAVYAIMFILVVRLFRSATKKRRPMVLSELNRIALEPLRAKCEAAQAAAEAAKPKKKLSARLASFRL